MTDRVNNVRLSFVNKTGEPYFTPNSFSTSFTENIQGRDESQTIPEAIDPKNAEVINPEDLFTVYYFIDGNFLISFNEQYIQLNCIFRILSTRRQSVLPNRQANPLANAQRRLGS